MKSDAELTGLGGWLVLVGISVVVTPFSWLLRSRETFLLPFDNEIWRPLTTEGSEIYNPLAAGIVVTNIVGNAVFIVGWIYLAILFFRKSPRFPPWFIWLNIGSLGYTLLVGIGFTVAYPGYRLFDAVPISELARSMLYMLITIPYLNVSRRVALTFVGRDTEKEESAAD